MTDVNNYSPAATGEGLVQFLDHAISKGYLKLPTGQAMKTSVKEVLSAVEGDDWEKLDLTGIDIDDVATRFQTLRRLKFSEGSLTTYVGRFKKSVTMFEAFRNGDSWRAGIRTL